MNNIVLIGRLTRDPELKYSNSGVAIGTFTLAVDRPYSKDGEKEADFIPVKAFKRQAENVAKYLEKGRQTAVEGRLQIRVVDGDDGKKCYFTEVIADRVEFLGSKESNEQSNDSNNSYGQEVVYSSEDDLPF